MHARLDTAPAAASLAPGAACGELIMRTNRGMAPCRAISICGGATGECSAQAVILVTITTGGPAENPSHLALHNSTEAAVETSMRLDTAQRLWYAGLGSNSLTMLVPPQAGQALTPWLYSLLHDRLDRARAASWRHPSLVPSASSDTSGGMAPALAMARLQAKKERRHSGRGQGQ